MVEKDGKRSWVMVHRVPVLKLWAAVVAEVLGFEHDEAQTLGRAVAGLNAHSKGASLGFFQPTPKEVKEQRRKMRKEETVTIDLLHRAVPARHTAEGLRALSGESPIHPESVQKYLVSKFADALEYVFYAMRKLAKSLPPSQLTQKAYGLHEKFRPKIPPDKKGWGASGKLDLDLIRKMATPDKRKADLLTFPAWQENRGFTARITEILYYNCLTPAAQSLHMKDCLGKKTLDLIAFRTLAVRKNRS